MIEDLRQDLIDRYNMSWQDAHMTDDLGIIQACKDNFKATLDKLIEECSNQSYSESPYSALP